MNQEKIRRAAAVTDVILDDCNVALQALQAPLWTNGSGVLSDPHMCARTYTAPKRQSTWRSTP